jgi:hypothetical protein
MKTPTCIFTELAEPFGCTPQAVFYMLQNLNITLKKDLYLLRKPEDKHAEYLNKIKNLPQKSVLMLMKVA